MRITRLMLTFGIAGFFFMSIGDRADAQKSDRTRFGDSTRWEPSLTERLGTYGHRNWIVIADSAYPAQARPAIETVVTRNSQLDVVKTVLEEISKCKHVRPIVYLDQELAFVPEKDAAGMNQYREDLGKLLAKHSTNSLPHEQIIAKLDEAGKTFRILVLKTDMILPYTSVFLELDCGYWSTDAEQRLREAMRSHAKDPKK